MTEKKISALADGWSWIMSKKLYGWLPLIFFVILLSACSSQPENISAPSTDFKIYYLDSNETKLVSESFVPKETDTIPLIWELIHAMEQDSKTITAKKVLSDTIQITKIAVKEKQLTVYFSDGYATLKGITEILSRAAVVKTLCQVEEVDCVGFYIGGQPLMASTGDKAVGYMLAEDFIDNTGGETNFFQNITINLFFANKSGKSLKEIRVNVDFDGTIPMEQLIVERLILGPENILNVDQDQVLPTMPKNTKLIKISIKDGVCYVDFDEAFLNKLPDITDEVAIYSVVNSLAEMTSVNKVQFSINGKQVSNYRENTEFDIPFERNLDIVK